MNHPPNFAAFWQVPGTNPRPTIGKLSGPYSSSGFLLQKQEKTDLNGARSQWMAKPSSSLQILYSYVCAEGKAPPGWMRIASHSVAVDVQLATNSTGLRLVRGFETSFKHLNHQSHVQWEKNTNYSVLQHHHLTSSNFSKIMPYSIHHPCRNFSSSAKSLRLGVTWASRRRWLSHRPDCSSKHWARRPRPCCEQGCFLRTEVTQPEWNMVT